MCSVYFKKKCTETGSVHFINILGKSYFAAALIAASLALNS